MLVRRCAVLLLLCFAAFPIAASAERPIVDLHKLDAYFALFAGDSNVPWKPTSIRLDTYSSAPVAFAVYQVDPATVLTAGSNERPRAIDTRGRRPVVTFSYVPPGGYQFQSSTVDVRLGAREGFFVVEARRGNVGEQVWINRTRVGLFAKETASDLLLYATDLGSGRAMPGMRVQLVVGAQFAQRTTDRRGIVEWTSRPRPVFALAQWGSSYAFLSLLPQAPVPNVVVGVRTDSAVVHAGDVVRIVGFARVRSGNVLRPASGVANVSMRLGASTIGEQSANLDQAGAFVAQIAIPQSATAGDYAVLAQTSGGIGGATVHVDANAGGLSLSVAAQCGNACDPYRDVPLEIRSSQGNRDVRVVVVRSPHVIPGASDTTAWATTKWLDTSVRTGDDGRAVVAIAHPTDDLASTYGVRVDAGGATANTRVVVPTARSTVWLHVDADELTAGTPLGFDVYARSLGDGKPVAGAPVDVLLAHGQSVQQQQVRLDGSGHARGAFTSAQLGTNLVFARLATPDGQRATDASQVSVVAQAAFDPSGAGSANVRVDLDRATYHSGDSARVDAQLDGSGGDALVTLDSALDVDGSVVPVAGGRAWARMRVRNSVGALRVGAAFVRDGSIEWNASSLTLDAPGRPATVALAADRTTFPPGQNATLTLRDQQPGAGTVVVRISRGDPSGSALFDSAPGLLGVGLATTQNSAPPGVTWHPWVDSTGNHAQVIGFVSRTGRPQDLTIAQAATQSVSWNVTRVGGAQVPVAMPAERGQYTLSVLKISDDGRVTAASSVIVVQ